MQKPQRMYGDLNDDPKQDGGTGSAAKGTATALPEDSSTAQTALGLFSASGYVTIDDPCNIPFDLELVEDNDLMQQLQQAKDATEAEKKLRVAAEQKVEDMSTQSAAGANAETAGAEGLMQQPAVSALDAFNRQNHQKLLVLMQEAKDAFKAETNLRLAAEKKLADINSDYERELSNSVDLFEPPSLGWSRKMAQRIVVVGVGSIGRRHARLLKAHQPELSVELCEPSQQMLDQASSETEWFEQINAVHSSFSEMLATKPFAVIICTPHSMHADMTIAALGAGCHVLCEKPMSDNLADAERMAAAALQADLALVIGFNNHFHPVVLRLKQLVDEGTLGAVRHAHAHIGTLVTLLNSGSRYQKDLEGALLLDYAHQPDLLYWLLGKAPRGVYMQGVGPGQVLETSMPNVAVVTLDFQPEEQLVATYHLNYIQMPERSTLELTGDKGWAVVDMKTGRITIGITGDREQAERGGSITEEVVESERDPMYVAEHADFLRATEGATVVHGVRASEGLVSMRVIDAALRSFKSGERVEIQVEVQVD